MDEQQTHMTDPQIEMLLDEALAPADPPPGLTDRIVAATQPPVQRRAVVARIGDGLPALAAAAMLALVMLGAWAMFDMPQASQPASPPVSLTALQHELGALDRATMTDTAHVDEQIELLELQLEMAGSDPLWPSGIDPLNEAGAQAQMYSLVSEPLWQF